MEQAEGIVRLALVLAAGCGTRMGGGVPKQYRCVAGVPMLRRTVENLLAHPQIDRVRVVIAPEHRGLYEASVGDLGLPEPVAGGATRQESARRGLEAEAERPPRLVLIHDAARPFASRGLTGRVLAALQTEQGAVPVLPVVDTLRRLEDDHLGADVARDGLVRVQTPQGFHFAAILEAHRRAEPGRHTDDAGVARAAGIPVVAVAGEEENMKITTEEDLARAERWLQCRARRFRTGFGYDVHAFARGRRLRLCGVELAHSYGLAGHSDADVALHALTDAILATVAAGDIGSHFPPADERWKDADSATFVQHALALLRARGGRLEHVDVTIVCERPRIGPHRERLRERLAAILGLPREAVSVKATTTEGLGFTGRQEGIAAHAVATASFEE